MLARIAVASDALDTGLDPITADAVHDVLLHHVNAHARLVFASNGEAMGFLRAITDGPGLSPTSRAKWKETLTHLHKYNRITVTHSAEHGTLADVRVLAELRREWGASSDLAIVSDKSCEPLGVPSDTRILCSDEVGPDVAIPATAPRSPALSRLRDLAEQSWSKAGTLRDTFWNDVLGPLAEDCQSVTVVDGYLFGSILDLHHQKYWTRRWGTEHIVWLLEHLDSVMRGGAEVHLIGASLRDYPGIDAPTTADVIRDSWKPSTHGRLARVSVHLAELQRGEKFRHDRHIRFSNGGAVLVHAGLDRLRDQRIWDEEGMNWDFRWHPNMLRELQAAEERARARADHPVALVLNRT